MPVIPAADTAPRLYANTRPLRTFPLQTSESNSPSNKDKHRAIHPRPRHSGATKVQTLTAPPSARYL